MIVLVVVLVVVVIVVAAVVVVVKTEVKFPLLLCNPMPKPKPNAKPMMIRIAAIPTHITSGNAFQGLHAFIPTPGLYCIMSEKKMIISKIRMFTVECIITLCLLLCLYMMSLKVVFLYEKHNR